MSSAWSQLDQLLTCAICLDRYRNPKLLPCQHTFCMEPCLEGLIDYARRQIKCPECRAEHRIPYQGVQAFPTNVTLVRFLELHRDITGEEPEPPPSMMERCNVCSEKANLERCAHCEKKICTDCKEAHVDILRREINRINNQVRRGLHRLSDALTQTKKNAEKLQLNCTQVKDEIEDIVRRYSKDLKHTEEKLQHDLEIYTQTELKSMSKLKEDLDSEVSNITSNCELVDKYIKDNTEWTDAELLEYKEIFLKTLDFLRTFDADNSDFSRRIKFQCRADPDVLHRNIADFGELKINAPVVPAPQQTLNPPSNALMRSQSDHRLAAQFARRQDNRSFADINQRLGGHTSDNEREGRPTSPLFSRGRRDTDTGYRRYSERSRDYDYQDREYGRSRYNREENSTSGLTGSRWREGEDYGHRSRYGRDYEDLDSEPQHTRTVRFAEDTVQNQSRKERVFDVGDATKGPLSGVVRLMDSSKVMERLHQNEARQKTQEKQAQEQSQAQPPVSAPPAPQPPPRRPPSRQQSEDDIDRQKKANKQQVASAAPASATPAPQSPEVPARQTTRRPTTQQKEEESKPSTTPERVQRVDSHSTEVEESTASPRLDTPPERSPEPPSRFRKQPSVTERGSESGEQERSLPPVSSTNETSRSTSRCPRPPLGKAASLEGPGAGAIKTPLDKKASLPAARKADVESEEDDDEDVAEDALENPLAIQSSFFSRFRNNNNNQPAPQRRLPDPEPRLLEGQDDESEEEDEEEDDDDEDEEEEDNVPEPDPKSASNKKEESEESESEETSSSSSSSSSESESSDEEDDDAAAEEPSKLPNMQRRRSSEDSVNSKSSSASTATSTSDSRSKKCDSEKGKLKSNTNSIYEDNEEENEDEDDDEVISDAVASTAENNNTTASERKRPMVSEVPTPERYACNSQPSDDTDGTDSASSNSTKYHSLSRNNTPVVSNGTVGRNDSVSSEGSSSSRSGSTSGSGSRFSGNSSRRPPLARSRSSHEIGLGIEVGDDLDDDEDEPPVVPSYRSRADRMSEGNNCYTRTRSRTQDENPVAALSSSSNNSWAKYLRSKYGSNATGRVVPRSRSSHSLYQRSDSDSSEDERPSGRDSVLSSGSYGFSSPRSTYLQKKRMLFKVGSRGTEPGNFTWPRGIAVGPDNSIVVADSSNHRVQVFDAIGKFLHEFGTYGSSEGEFDCLAGVAVNRIGQYIVSDRYNQRIQLFDPQGRFLRAFGCEGRTDGRFNYPWGITTDSLGFIYVCDKENHRIQVFQSDGTFVGKFGSIGSRPGQLEHPHYIAVSNTNRVIVSDSNNHRIQIFDVNGRSLTTFGSEGSADGQFKFPRGVAVDDQGYIIVGDSGNNRVQVFHPDGVFLKAFGTWGGGDGEFKGIEGIAVTSGGSILVCDRENHRIQVF